MSQSIRVAIYGGRLAGATVLYALLPHPHLDVHIFESASDFKEAGAAVGMTCNAQAALELISYTATECLERARAVPQKGPQGDSGPRVTTIVHRAAFLRELLAGLPPDRMHASKKLENVDRDDDGSLTVHFSDGSTHDCDILIGADGIHSTVRKLILGEDDPAAVPRNSGCWAIMALKPYAGTQASIGTGPIYIEDSQEHGWIGDGTFLMHDLLSEGQIVQFVVTAYDQEAVGSERWHRTVSADELRRLFQDWLTHLKKAVEKGSGGGISVEDSFILSPLLGHAKTTKDTVNALKAYDEVRRPRTQPIVKSSWVTGEIMTGRGGETKMPLDQVKEKLVHRWDFIFGIELEKHRDEAISIMDRLVQGEGS
ncbi:salicylate hydroxylase [Diaporthe sp. PMI_573]|nr:salicylate hydroxylase [Diaporthaceae sp. PMI_573]